MASVLAGPRQAGRISRRLPRESRDQDVIPNVGVVPARGPLGRTPRLSRAVRLPCARGLGRGTDRGAAGTPTGASGQLRRSYRGRAGRETPARVCSAPVRDEAGLFPSLRRLRVLLRHSRLRRTEARSRAAWAVLAWAVLAGLFFMHGAPSSAGCPDGAAMTPVTVTAAPAPPVAVSGAAAGTVRLTAARLPARSTAAGARQSAVHAPPASRGTSEERGSCCEGLCSSRQPRQGSGGASAACPAAVVPLPVTAALPVRCLTAAPRSDRPPGRPGLPLPLFLGVSRT